MAVLEHLEPGKVFHFFEEISAIPRGSTNTKKISDWCVAFAKARGLEYYQDSLNNVIIIKEATPGYEKAEPVILQGHLDMVCEKAPDCIKDMEKEGIDLVIDGDRIRAKGTTLGGDNGIAVAMALAVLDAGDLAHPRVEAVFTIDEEIGMLGAIDLDMSPLKGRRLINIDSEEEGIFTVSCAGGNTTRCRLPFTCEPFAGTVMEITVGGMLGGHSGAEIDKRRANASMLLGRLLYSIKKKSEIRLITVDGGKKDNAIPREAHALIAVADADAVRTAAAEMQETFRFEYQTADPDIFVKLQTVSTEGVPMDALSTAKVINMLVCLPNGIQEMSADIEGLVQTSLNLGVLLTEEQTVLASFCVRSSIATQKQMLVDRLACQMELLGGDINIYGDYPGWEYKQDSALRDLMVRIFEKQYGYAPQISAIHAGLECGMFMGKLPDLDCISIGPDMTEVHTYRESMSISSIQRVWGFLTEVLKCSK
ncbi:MAG: aminoacyl-histidine dipeptidase [Lachnospiraceae bacterium]